MQIRVLAWTEELNFIQAVTRFVMRANTRTAGGPNPLFTYEHTSVRWEPDFSVLLSMHAHDAWNHFTRRGVGTLAHGTAQGNKGGLVEVCRYNGHRGVI